MKMLNRKRLSFTLVSALAFMVGNAFAATGQGEQPHKIEVVLAEDVKWGYLNPLRGDKSPSTGELWGSRTSTKKTGMLVKFKKGFSSPPHIHNITYRGIVLDGLLHNDDPDAEIMWMPPGSFWTQPAGQNHITAANGSTNRIYLEIEHGPYLVKPSKEQFSNGETPINVHVDNLVWQSSQYTQILANDINGEMATLWGNLDDKKELRGYFLKFNEKFNGHFKINAEEFRLVVIKGSGQTKKSGVMKPGSYVGAAGKFTLPFETDTNTTIYIRTNGEVSAVKK